MTRKKTFDYLIAGSGLAGLATAFFLAERGAGRVAVTDPEPGPGLAASSRSASMICQLVRDPVTCRLMLRSARLLREVWLRRYPDVRFDPCGSLHIGRAGDLETFAVSVRAARGEGVEVERLTRNETVRQFPALERSSFEEALWCPSDGVLDTGRLIWRLWQDLMGRGVRFAFQAEGTIREVPSDAEGGVKGGFEASAGGGGWLAAPALVNAAGAWAGVLARSLGCATFQVQPMRRHVFVTAALRPRLKLPIVWDVTNDIYVRPDGDAVMTSPCDEEPQPPGPCGVSEPARELLEKKLQSFFPAALGAKHVKIWSGLRTFSKDRKFVIGWDLVQKNMFWTACLGGYGVTAAAGCGDLSAGLLTGAKVSEEFRAAFEPGRF